jgi:hypothetical protein
MASQKIKKAEELYLSKLRPVLESTQKGKYVAIDVASGDYFVGSEILEAYEKASQKYPDRTFVYKRIGYPAARFVGSR